VEQGYGLGQNPWNNCIEPSVPLLKKEKSMHKGYFCKLISCCNENEGMAKNKEIEAKISLTGPCPQRALDCFLSIDGTSFGKTTAVRWFEDPDSKSNGPELYISFKFHPFP